ncbi:MAG: NCS1 family nucleobase:cation symporter-1 [Bacteroidia bacterium]|nr:NCS1 family nucleobase:cation symporter-1 [Bacteroidia bacterium]MBT8279895.1 NCS1 family nucleobase:cation symporter-1 [Bacteroidia bacterium]NNK60709.1 NCS1 family nucleobase:cation symporter-1 [Flavobacteriaceae bacterium]NNL33907.1 NCS1 family nucleobase:cation symporter-1 [Flavobacteriaceae bacterium]
MSKEIIELQEDLSNSPLYSDDLAPVSAKNRTWSKWHLAAIWVGMAVCIPTYLLASYMIKTGLNWYEALIIIGLANLIITVPMVLNGHAGVKYGIPFPVIGRAAFGTKGVHLASVTRGIIACGWFGVQTWIGGLAIYAIFHAVLGTQGELGLSVGKFVGFGIFWLINMYFIWKGTESIKWLETYSAPILIIMGVALIYWSYAKADGFAIVLDQSQQLEKTAATITQENDTYFLSLNALHDKEGQIKVDEYKLLSNENSTWLPFTTDPISISDPDDVQVQFRNSSSQPIVLSSIVTAGIIDPNASGSKLWSYLLWLTAMVGFWATMSISIADITRFAATQKDQVVGQFIGLPATMMLYSFVGIFVTCAAVINFQDVLIADDAPWDPVSLIAKIKSPVVVVIAQIFMIIATLSTNIAANVIAPSNAFSNLYPKRISFRTGGIITGLIGILIAPWWLLNEISGFLIFVSGLLGPVLGILIADYFVVRKKNLELSELYKVDGKYSYGKTGFSRAAMIALFIGVFLALIGYWIPALDFLYSLSWFTGFIISFVIYVVLKKKE